MHSLSDLPSPSSTSVSIITPPKVKIHGHMNIENVIYAHFNRLQITLGLLDQAKALSIPALWLQPGAEDESVIAYIRDNGLSDKVIFGGPCILVEGDGIIRSLL